MQSLNDSPDMRIEPITTTMETTKTLRIPIKEKILGCQLTKKLASKISKAIESNDQNFRDSLASVIENHHYSDDKQRLRDEFVGMKVSTHQFMKKDALKFYLVCENVPENSLFDRQRLTPAQFQQFSSLVRDLLIPLSSKNKPLSPQGTSEWVKQFVKRTGLLSRGERSIVSFVWGGHSLPTDYIGEFTEERFAEKVGYFNTLINTQKDGNKKSTITNKPAEDITGSGPGVMKAPFKGALQAFHELRQNLNRHFIGFTEPGIMAAEKPNKLVDRLIIFPDIEKRMEAFIRSSHRGRVHPGGIGTLEEIMFFFSMKLHPNNEDAVYPFDLVERPGGRYFDYLEDYLTLCFGDTLKPHYQLFNRIPPRDYALYVRDSNEAIDRSKLWNDDLYIPETLQVPLKPDFSLIESLELYEDLGPFKLMENLRAFFSALVTFNIKSPEIVASWKDERPLLKGDEKIVEATDQLIKWFSNQGRLKIEGEFMKPYRTYKD